VERKGKSGIKKPNRKMGKGNKKLKHKKVKRGEKLT
jgi:hypothetical protein